LTPQAGLISIARRRLRAINDVVDYDGDIIDYLRFSVYKFFQLEVPSSRAENRLIGPREFALMLVSIGLGSLLLATIEHLQNIRAIGAKYAGNQRSLAGLLPALISVLGIVALLAMIFRQ